jgi:ABC-2 type transport system ATP-binding protein
MMASSSPAVIQTRGLSKRYRRVTALSEATIDVPEGRVSALIGPNGAGKTTLLRILAGLARPTGGEVAVLGSPPRQGPAYLAGVGFLAQDVARRASGPGRTAQGHHGHRARPHPRAGRAHRPTDHAAHPPERAGH